MIELVGNLVVGFCAGVAGLAWLYAVVHWVRALRLRRPDVSLGTLLANGIKSFDERNFLPEGQVHQRAFMRGLLIFFVALFCGAGGAVLRAATAAP